jgi:hypothetical protein
LIIAVWLSFSAVVAYASAGHTIKLMAVCRGGPGAGGGAGIGLLGILIFTTAMFAAVVALSIFRRASKLNKAFIAFAGLAGVPLLLLLLVSAAASSPQSPLSCARAYVAAGGVPPVIVTIHSDTDVTLWRTREASKPQFIGSISEAVRLACSAPSDAYLFIVTYTSWRPPQDLLDACRPRVSVLAPAA